MSEMLLYHGGNVIFFFNQTLVSEKTCFSYNRAPAEWACRYEKVTLPLPELLPSRTYIYTCVKPSIECLSNM